MTKENKQEKISARDAVKSAITFYQEAADSDRSGTLEEIENKDGYWYVTIGFRVQNTMIPIDSTTKYRVFKVSEKTGIVESMKMRE